MQGIGEVHSTPHPSDRIGDATDVLANHGRQCDQLAESISDAAAIEMIESAKNPFGFQYNRLRQQYGFPIDNRSGTRSLGWFVIRQQTDDHVSIDREHAGPLPQR